MILQLTNAVGLVATASNPIINTQITSPIKTWETEYQNSDVEDFVKDVSSFIVGHGVGETVGAVVGGMFGEVPGLFIGMAAGAIVDKIFRSLLDGKTFDMSVTSNPNHYYAMGTGVGITPEKDQYTKNCNHLYYNASNCKK